MPAAPQGSPEPETTESAETPSPVTAEQVSKIVQEAMDSRVSGIMSTYDKQLGEVREDLRKATLSEDEIDNERDEAEAEELSRLRRENAILSAGTEMPDAVKAFNELNGKGSGKEQLEFLQSLIDAGKAGEAPADSGDEQEEEDDTAQVDPNRRQGVPPGMSDEAADAILDQYDSWPGPDFWRS